MARILIVDDDSALRRVLRRMFERSSYDVVEAESAAAALAVLDGPDTLDAIVSDVLMPDVDGLAFYREVARRAPHLRHRVVFLTGASGDPRIHRVIEQLGVPLLGKLGDLHLVVDAIAVALLRRTPA